jgi:hypothetical protein
VKQEQLRSENTVSEEKDNASKEKEREITTEV